MQSLTLEHWPIDRLVDYARNRRRNDHVVDRMCSAITEFGLRIPIVARSDEAVVDGCGRFPLAEGPAYKSVMLFENDDRPGGPAPPNRGDVAVVAWVVIGAEPIRAGTN